jgi:chromate reductase, NAD(P)H dehydrogenase (quinone)
MSYTPKILAFAGSLRAASLNKKIVNVAAEGARKAGAEVTVIDLKQFPLPIYDSDLIEEEGFEENAVRLQEILLAHDGLIVASPEYNGSITGALKNMFDWTSRARGDLKLGACYAGKVAAIMSASPGSFGGIRCLSHLRGILSIMLVNVLPEEFAVGKAHEGFDDNAVFKDEKMRVNLERHGANVVETLKKLRG